MQKHKIVLLLILSFILISCTIQPSETDTVSKNRKSYGVFIGLGPDNIDSVMQYDIVVIDASYFTKQQIKLLRDAGTTVYSYINPGSIEKFRDYYEEFAPYALGDYAGWPDEKWMDVSNPAWQKYVINTLAKSLREKGVDGYFVDNTDVYYVYPEEKIYSGIMDILKSLAVYGLPVIINGGDTFVERALQGDLAHTPVKGINQESVFTAGDPETGAMGLQNSETTGYFLEYLSRCKDNRLDIYLTEYAPKENRQIRERIAHYCRERQYLFYIASSFKLDE
jgi:hypothetical protein